MNAFASLLPPRILLGLGLVFVAGLRADNSIQISVNPGAGQTPISPYIYGTNQDLPGVAAPGSRRNGGNRLTGYNWETNASNAGMDWYNSSDNFMVSGLPASQQSIPAIALTLFHDQSLAVGAPYTVLTLQMAGYVAADEGGTVTAAQAAPSSRWNAVVNNKPGGVYLNPPNLSDGTVYMDEVLIEKTITNLGSNGRVNCATFTGAKLLEVQGAVELRYWKRVKLGNVYK